MAKEQHLTYFKVENFKRFDSLELTDIGQFNLIVGDNNVGKTSLLEALFCCDGNLNERLQNLHSTLYFRGIYLQAKYDLNSSGGISNIHFPEINYLTLILRDASNPLVFHVEFDNSGRKHSSISISEKPTFDEIQKYNFPLSAKFYVKEKRLYAWLYSDDLALRPEQRYLPLIKFGVLFGHDLSYFYNEQVGIYKEKRSEVESLMRLFIPDLEYFQQVNLGDNQHIVVSQKGSKIDLPLASFGDGTTKLFRVVLEVLKNKGKRVFIDEIDTGIHHSRMKEFLKTVFKVAQLNDVQLFMTTHSQECQKAFLEVFDEEQELQNEARQFSLVEKNGQVTANCMKYKSLRFAFEAGVETRGGM